MEVQVSPTMICVIISATRKYKVVGKDGQRIREVTQLIQRRFGFPEGFVLVVVEKVAVSGLSANHMAESLRYKLVSGQGQCIVRR